VGNRRLSLLNVVSASSASGPEPEPVMAAIIAVSFIIVAFATLGAVVYGLSRL
jgi:hypothetical protein